MVRVTLAQLAEIMCLYRRGLTTQQIARLLGRNQSTISYIVTREDTREEALLAAMEELGCDVRNWLDDRCRGK